MGLDLRAGREDGCLPTDPAPQWPYVWFGDFRRALAAHIGIDLSAMRGFGGEQEWSTVDSPLKHLLGHSDCDGELSPQQAAELAPALRQALAEMAQGEAVCRPQWEFDCQAGEEFVHLLELCAGEGLPVLFC